MPIVFVKCALEITTIKKIWIFYLNSVKNWNNWVKIPIPLHLSRSNSKKFVFKKIQINRKVNWIFKQFTFGEYFDDCSIDSNNNLINQNCVNRIKYVLYGKNSFSTITYYKILLSWITITRWYSIINLVRTHLVEYSAKIIFMIIEALILFLQKKTNIIEDVKLFAILLAQYILAIG